MSGTDRTYPLTEPPVLPELLGRMVPKVNSRTKVEGIASRVTKAMKKTKLVPLLAATRLIPG